MELPTDGQQLPAVASLTCRCRARAKWDGAHFDDDTGWHDCCFFYLQRSRRKQVMSGSIYKAGAGAILQQMRLDVYANNLANVNTAGFKADNPVFRFDTSTVNSNGTVPTEQLSPYALPLEYVTDFDTGPLQSTGNPLDVAVLGEGFLEVQTPEGTRYTRNGHLSINDDGVLSTPQGWPVMGQGGEISIDGSRIEIGEDGEISVDGDVTGHLACGGL
jgi:flagellar basal-body rod protein FlgF